MFEPRARILKLLGSELISDDVVAITELVKNAHDADASMVSVSFHHLHGGDGEIVIQDDGCGMDLDTLLTKWMQPAGSAKNSPAGRRSPRGRRVLGAKGVGRFAADKLGRYLELFSRPEGEEVEVRASFDWDEYANEERLLSEIQTRWEAGPPVSLHEVAGTVLRISGLRTRWTERRFRKLSTRLARLRTPFDELDDFAICIESDEFPDYSGELGNGFLDRAPYRIDALFDGYQDVTFHLNGGKEERLVWNGAGELLCGPARLRIHAFDLETDAIARLGPRMEARAWLRQWSGISVYRDGFRIWPYGEPHDDWLRLDQRRVNNPVVRLSNNQVIGFVEITADGNTDLVDQTNREGLIHNRAFEDLRKLILFVMQRLESERQAIRRPTRNGRSRPTTGRKRSLDLVAEIERFGAGLDGGSAGKLTRLIGRLRKTMEREELDRRRAGASLQDLAAGGQAAADIRMHLETAVRGVGRSLGALRAQQNGTPSDHLDILERDLEMLGRQVSLLGTMSTAPGDRRRTIDIRDSIDSLLEAYGPVLVSRGISVEVTGGQTDLVRTSMRPEAFGRLAQPIITNAIEWVDGATRPRLRIDISGNGTECSLLFSDSGPGIARDLDEKVFEPHFSLKHDGNGMGLTISRVIVEQHGGSVGVDRHCRRRGANIRVTLPMRRSRATIRGQDEA